MATLPLKHTGLNRPFTVRIDALMFTAFFLGILAALVFFFTAYSA